MTSITIKILEVCACINYKLDDRKIFNFKKREYGSKVIVCKQVRNQKSIETS